MKKLLFASLLALSTIGAYAQVASPTPTPSLQEQIDQAQLQLQLGTIKSKIRHLDDPTRTPAPVTVINNNNNNNNNVAPAPAPVVQPVVVQPVIVEVPTPAPAPAPVVQTQYPAEMQWILNINDAFNNHNSSWVTQFTSGSINYFGHVKSSDNYILRDMANDDNTYLVGRSTYYPDTFRHEVSNEYSAKWSGPMIYDSITLYTEVQERYGRMHRFTERFTVGYTYENRGAVIYALVMKVL